MKNSKIFSQMIPITAPEEVQHLESLIQDIVDKPAHFNNDWLIKKGWLAVPAQSASHFTESDAQKISRAIQAISCEMCFAVATEPIIDFPSCFQVPATGEGLLDFSWTCSQFNFVLVPENKSFAILCTVYDYFIVAGVREFVKYALGGDIQAARAEFNEFASDESWKGRLLAVAKRYEELPASDS